MERINREALFSDETEDYRHPCEADAGQEVIFYFRTERDGADAVYLIEYDKQDRPGGGYLFLRPSGGGRSAVAGDSVSYDSRIFCT